MGLAFIRGIRGCQVFSPCLRVSLSLSFRPKPKSRRSAGVRARCRDPERSEGTGSRGRVLCHADTRRSYEAVGPTLKLTYHGCPCLPRRTVYIVARGNDDDYEERVVTNNNDSTETGYEC